MESLHAETDRPMRAPLISLCLRWPTSAIDCLASHCGPGNCFVLVCWKETHRHLNPSRRKGWNRQSFLSFLSEKGRITVLCFTFLKDLWTKFIEETWFDEFHCFWRWRLSSLFRPTMFWNCRTVISKVVWRNKIPPLSCFMLLGKYRIVFCFEICNYLLTSGS